MLSPNIYIGASQRAFVMIIFLENLRKIFGGRFLSGEEELVVWCAVCGVRCAVGWDGVAWTLVLVLVLPVGGILILAKRERECKAMAVERE